jgi:hypothetical protein
VCYSLTHPDTQVTYLPITLTGNLWAPQYRLLDLMSLPPCLTLANASTFTLSSMVSEPAFISLTSHCLQLLPVLPSQHQQSLSGRWASSLEMRCMVTGAAEVVTAHVPACQLCIPLAEPAAASTVAADMGMAFTCTQSPLFTVVLFLPT